MVTAQNKFVRNRPVLTTALLSQRRASTCYSLLRRRRIHLHSPNNTPPCDNTSKVSFLILFVPPPIARPPPQYWGCKCWKPEMGKTCTAPPLSYPWTLRWWETLNLSILAYQVSPGLEHTLLLRPDKTILLGNVFYRQAITSRTIPALVDGESTWSLSCTSAIYVSGT